MVVVLSIFAVVAMALIAHYYQKLGYLKGYQEAQKDLLLSAIKTDEGIFREYKTEVKSYYVHLKTIDESKLYFKNNCWGSRIELKRE